MTTAEANGLRYRRAQSVTRAEEIQYEEKKVRKSQPDKPCHHPQDSLFSWTSGFDNFTGFVNWAFLLLSLGGLRLLLENFIKYGIRVDPIQWLNLLKEEDTADHPTIILIIYILVPIMVSLIIEKALAVEIIPQNTGLIAQVVNLLVLVLIPMVAIHVNEGISLTGASLISFGYCIVFLKLWSYVQVNSWCRKTLRGNGNKSMRRQSLSFSNLPKKNGTIKTGSVDEVDQESQLVQYPENLNLKDLFYFMFAPTFCYELNFPRTTRIRKRFLLKRILEVAIGIQIMLIVCQQYIIPSVKNSLIPFSNMDITKATERLLKLALPNHLLWLCMFYIVFHSSLNLVGELMHFADRKFYCDWWNSNNIETFWRTWNMPVHRWAVRHLYVPLVGMGYSNNVGYLAVFFVSAFFHEYLVSVPLRTFKIWAFMGMMGQVPLSFISRYTEKKFGPRLGNVVVWASLIVGQPLCIMIYYHDYVIEHYGKALIEDHGHV